MVLSTKDMTTTTQHKSAGPGLVFTFYCEPFGIVSASENAINPVHPEQVLHAYNIYTPTMIFLINTGEITKM